MSLTRLAASISIRSTYCHGMTRGGIFSSSARSVNDGTSPLATLRTAPRAPTSTASTSKAIWLSTGFEKSSTSLTRTTLRPCTSMICWSSRSRFSSRTPSKPENACHVSASLVARTVAPYDFTSSAGSMRSPFAVRTTKNAIRVACSCGATAISRTRPRTDPLLSRTGAPSISDRATTDMRVPVWTTCVTAWRIGEGRANQRVSPSVMPWLGRVKTEFGMLFCERSISRRCLSAADA